MNTSTLVFQCGTCGAGIMVGIQLVGTTVRCPACSAALPIPKTSRSALKWSDIRPLVRGKPPERLVKSLVKRGWTEDGATRIVNTFHEAILRRRESCFQRLQRSKRGMIQGAVGIVLGALISVVGHLTSRHGTYYVDVFTVACGVAVFLWSFIIYVTYPKPEVAVTCPHCNTSLDVGSMEIAAGKLSCPACGGFVNITAI